MSDVEPGNAVLIVFQHSLAITIQYYVWHIPQPLDLIINIHPIRLTVASVVLSEIVQGGVVFAYTEIYSLNIEFSLILNTHTLF